MGEVTSAVIATSLVLIAVFVPVSFFPGATGILYRQFSLTIAFSIAISAFNALTLSPALSALLLRGEEDRPHQLDFLHIRFVSRAFAAFIHGADNAISWLASTYARSIHAALQVRYLLLLVFFVGLGATVWMYQKVPSAFSPQEDQGYMMVVVEAPPGSSMAYTGALAERVSAIISQNPDIDASFSVIGFSFSGSASNAGMMFVNLKPSDQRRGKGHSAAEIVADLSPKLGSLMFSPNGGIVAVFQPPAVEGVGSFGGFAFMLQDQGKNTLSDLDRVADDLLSQRPAGAGDHRPRKGQGNGGSALPDHHHTQRLHGIGIRQRLRLQQPHLSRFRAGRSALPHDIQGPALFLRALGFRADGSPG
jgi:HAE1 family hydrophobic/amphiphilic exporter-1